MHMHGHVWTVAPTLTGVTNLSCRPSMSAYKPRMPLAATEEPLKVILLDDGQVRGWDSVRPTGRRHYQSLTFNVCSGFITTLRRLRLTAPQAPHACDVDAFTAAFP